MIPSETLSRFVQLFTLNDADATQRVSERLALAIQDPAAYQEQFAEELEERGIVAPLPAQELRDIALIDALLGEELAWESDWNETSAEIADGINEILTRQKTTRALLPAALLKRGQPGPEQLDAVQDALESLGLALVLFSLDSDSFPLGVVADAQAETARRLAADLGFQLTVY
ncbi:DUF6630 family protein [Hymenobacter sedentarius]|uniref:DUF6630 family protein n=1 Tax=Hymenobacter sedentarius TaxID=1411621 RepID=UPI0012FE54D6|nr:hypothetical protein [Hymenobacter sedentarius]